MRCTVRRKSTRPQRVDSTRLRHEFTSPSSPTSCCGARHIRRDQTSWLYFCAITLGGWRPVSKDYLTMTKNQTEVRFQSFTSGCFFFFSFLFFPFSRSRSRLSPEMKPLPERCVTTGLYVHLCVPSMKTRIMFEHEAED